MVHGHIMACINVVLGMKRDMIYCLGGCGYGYYCVQLQCCVYFCYFLY